MNSITINVPVVLSAMEVEIRTSVTDMDLIIPVDVGQTVRVYEVTNDD